MVYSDEKRNFLNKFIKYFKDYYIHDNQCLYFEMENVKLIVYIENPVKGFCDKDTVFDITTDDVSLNIIGSKLMKKDLFILREKHITKNQGKLE